MDEPDVTLTDYALALLCGALAWGALRSSRAPIRLWLIGFLVAVGLASLFGGTVHGFFEDEDSRGHALLWPATMLSVGIAAVAAAGLGARVRWPARAPAITSLAVLSFLPFAAAVLSGRQDFSLAIAYYVPAAGFLFVSFALALRARPTRARALALVGLGLTFVAAAIQQLQLGVHAAYFDHNALYHVVQAVALVLSYLGASRE